MSYYGTSSSMSYENKMYALESNLRAINNNYYNGVSSNNMEKYMYYSALSNACSSAYSGNSSSSSCGRSMGREPNYTVGQWSIEGVL
jgi:hypothetical protein